MPMAPRRFPSAVLINTPPGTGTTRPWASVLTASTKLGLLLRPLEDRARAETERQRAIGFAVGDLGSQKARSILHEGRFQAAAGVQDHHGERAQTPGGALRQRCIEDGPGDFQ